MTGITDPATPAPAVDDDRGINTRTVDDRPPAVDAREGLTLNPTPLEKLANDMTGGDPINDMAIRLMRAWAKADPRSNVAQYPASYIANFACMADAAMRGNLEKAKHHTISTAAALGNWHAALTGADNRMRPGIDPAALSHGEAERG